MTPTPAIDILAVVQQTYRLLWTERHYVLRLAMVPVTIIIINSLLVFLTSDQFTFLQTGLLLLPAMIAETWLVCQFLRTVMTGEYWPQALRRLPNGDIPPILIARAKALLAAMVFYLLIMVLLAAFKGTMMETMPVIKPESGPPRLDPNHPYWGLFLLVFMVLCISNFRLFWLHIPLVVGIPIGRYVAMTRPRIINLQMLGVWLAAMMPVMLVWIFLVAPLTQEPPGTSFILAIVATSLSVILQSFLALAVTTAIALALRPLLIQTHDR